VREFNRAGSGFRPVPGKRGTVVGAWKVIVHLTIAWSVLHVPLTSLSRPVHAAVRVKQKRTVSGDIKSAVDTANWFIKSKRYEEAITILEPICRDYPRSRIAFELLSMCYIRAGRPHDAVTLLEVQLKTAPDHFPYIKELGHAYLDLGQWEQAVEAWGRILKDDKKYAGYYGLIAKLEQEAGLYDEALRTLRAGRKFAHYDNIYTNQIIRLERILGRWDSAFRETLLLLSKAKEPRIERARLAVDIFRNSGRQEQLIAMVDSISAAGAGNSTTFRIMRVVLSIEVGRNDEAERYLNGSERDIPSEKELYLFISFLAGMRDEKRNELFISFFKKSLDLFLARYASSPVAPGVMLMMVSRYREEAMGAGATDHLARAVQMADNVLHHPLGAPYRGRAALLKARMQLEDLHMPRRALETLDAVQWRGREQILAAEELRLRALLASGRWELSERRFTQLVTHSDSAVADLGRYGLGRLHFLTGDYEKAVRELSVFAEKNAESKWANDALETAMMVKKSLDEGREPLDLYRTAYGARESGDFNSALDSLDAFESRYSWSVLFPRVLFERAELETLAGRSDEARLDLERLAERFPLSGLAPRALERIGLLLERENPEEAVRRYEEIMERYPDDPFLERVRTRYIAIQKSIGERAQ